MKVKSTSVVAFCTWLLMLVCGLPVAANDAISLITDPNNDRFGVGLAFGSLDTFAFGFSQDESANVDGNKVLRQTQGGSFSGAGFSVPISNGENDIDKSFDGDDENFDVRNAEPVNLAISAANGGGKLANGNVVRFSSWLRSDPDDPITVEPQIEPVLKLEFWKEALSTHADTDPGKANPSWGDKIVDLDQHLGEGLWADVGFDGVVIDASAADEERVRAVDTDDWTLMELTYEVDDSQWLGIGDAVYTVEDVEDVRAVMFWGDYTGTNVRGNGSLLSDNILVEIFSDQGAVTPLHNPRPGTSVGHPCDFSGNGTVDFADFVMFSNVFGMAAREADETNPGGPTFDKNGSGTVDFADFVDFSNNFGATGSVANVPEPTGLALLMLGVCLVLIRRAVFTEGRKS